MKKKLLAALLALAMVVALVPVTVFAADDDPWLPTAEISLSSENITAGQSFNLTVSNLKKESSGTAGQDNYEGTINSKIKISTTNSESTTIESVSITGGSGTITVPADVVNRAGESVTLTVGYDGNEGTNKKDITVKVVAGEAATLTVETQPVGPSESGGKLVTQPKVKVIDAE